jgi:hypothetical protein
MKKTLPLLALIILCICCNNSPKPGGDKKDYYTIHFERCMKSTSQFNLSEIADTIEYIKLKTPRNVIITSIRRIVYSEPYIFLTSKGIAYQFTKDGEFVRQIGRIGKGPGEYLAVENIYVDDAKKEIILGAVLNIVYYNFNGGYLRSLKIMAQASAMLDSTIWIANPSHGYEKLKLFGVNQHFDTIAALKNDDIWESRNKDYWSVVSKALNPFYHYNNKLYFKGYEDSDSIWEVDGSSIKLHAAIDMGKYKLQLENRPDYAYDNFNKNGGSYYRVPAVTEDNRFIFLLAGTWDGKLVTNILFEKSSGKGFSLKQDSLNGITDDIVHGPPFWPLTITDKYYIGVIEADDLLNSVDADSASPSLRKLMSGIDENTNQLLILAKRISRKI